MSADVKEPGHALPARSVEITRDLDAPVELVWKALTDPAEIVRWFPTDAVIDPRPGGRYTISWEGQWQWDMTITDWEPSHRLRMVDRQARPFDADGQPIANASPVELALEFTLEARGNRTTLRLVQSGFGHGSTWDDEIDGVTLGWHVELSGLLHYLTHHRGHDRRTVWAHATTDRSLAAVWSQLVAPTGLVTNGVVETHAAGDRCRLVLASGDIIDGTVIFSAPSRQLVVSAESFADGLFRLSLDRAAGRTMVQIWLSSWRSAPAEVAAFGDRVRTALDRVFQRM